MSKDKIEKTKITIPMLRNLYHQDQKISAITAYDYTMARIVDSADVDIVLVGDSLGMVVQGETNTLPVDIDHMIYHTKCVSKGIKKAHVMADMPFMSYQSSHEDAVSNAGKLLKAGAESIKLEGGEEIADLVWYLNKIGIPVMGHIGLKPQSIHTMGGYKAQGRSKVDADNIFNDAQALEEAGAFGLLLEGIPQEVANEITQSVNIPTIGIGSGPDCSGQILVVYDVLGADPEFKPKFVRHYMNMHESASKALKTYIKDVQDGFFPNEAESMHRNLVEVKAGGGKK
ncbi:3-methyl-2-oxobutanoate hydroxymethyltransferase [bacterium K02(2017)]|nr:3-methyl-2-oxobutanoate hydroxymethyltransferase [bacterium K02(2017)]